MKQIIVILIASLVLIPSLISLTASADSYNFSITSVRSNPEKPVKGSRVNFIVDVTLKGENPCVDVHGFIDGRPITVNGNMGKLILAHLIIQSQSVYFPVTWPNDDKPHTLKFVVDYLGQYDETNEKDNVYTITLTADSSGSGGSSGGSGGSSGSGIGSGFSIFKNIFNILSQNLRGLR